MDWKNERFRKKMERRRIKAIKKLEKRELKLKNRQEKLAKKQEELLKKSGITLDCIAKRVSVSHKLNENILECIFCYQGDWFAMYITQQDTLSHNLAIRCTSDALENEKVTENTFKVSFIPKLPVKSETPMVLSDISNFVEQRMSKASVVKKQTIWLTPDLYTRFTGHGLSGKGDQSNQAPKSLEAVTSDVDAFKKDIDSLQSIIDKYSH